MQFHRLEEQKQGPVPSNEKRRRNPTVPPFWNTGNSWPGRSGAPLTLPSLPRGGEFKFQPASLSPAVVRKSVEAKPFWNRLSVNNRARDLLHKEGFTIGANA